MTTSILRGKVAFALLAGSSVLAAPAADESKPQPTPPPADLFEAPVRLKVKGAAMDSGKAWGHSSPATFDLNGDGKLDLVVGDFSGKFRRYLNVGSKTEPQYVDDGLLQGGSEDAKVHIYCCIGAQPRFHDFDGDGVRDMLANSYDPGHAYLFRGLPDGKFAAREEIVDKAGVPVRTSPVQKQDYQSYGSFYEAVDWDADGDLDLLIGTFGGELKVRLNEGSATKPVWASENVTLKAADGKEQFVKAHLCPVVADWDGDGLWDVIAGSEDGSVTLFRNTGRKGAPVLAAGQTLVSAHDGHGYNRAIWDAAKVSPGIRSQPEVVDFNGDGKLDLLVGDFYTAYDFKEDLSEEQRAKVMALVAENEAAGKAGTARMDALLKDFATRYPGEAIYSEKATKEWSVAYKALRESPEAKERKAKGEQFEKDLRPFLATVRGEDDLAQSHGHVWLFLRK